MNNSIIFFVKIKKEFLYKWEYYENDINMLKRSYENVYICNSYLDFFIYIFKFKKTDIFCWWWHNSSPIIILGRILNKKVYCTGAIHMFDYSGAPDFYSKSFFYRFFSKISLKYASINLFISEDQLLSITSHLQVNNPILLHSSLSIKDPIKTLETKNLILNYSNFNKIQFLYFSWLTESQVLRKGLIPLLKAFSIYLKNSNNNSILIIGGKDGGYLNYIKDYIEKLKISNNIIFKINVSIEEKNNLYSTSNLLIAPSYMEGFGNATLEAMSYGCPVVVSRFGASHEVVGNTGYIINEIDEDSILDILNNYNTLSNKDKLNQKIAAFNRANEIFSFESRVQKFLNL
jgi:glycosyltransferase involved in cell wall biosynthesis